MKYDTMFKFTTDNSVMWVGVFLARGGKDLGTHRLTCDELAEWLLERENKKGDTRTPNGGANRDQDENDELRAMITKLKELKEELFERNNTQADTLLALVTVFDHPDREADELGYLTDVMEAIRLLRLQDSDESHKVATRLTEFVPRVKTALETIK